MNREIKFRAWDKENEKMMYLLDPEYRCQYSMYFYNNIERKGVGLSYFEGEPQIDTHWFPGDIIFQQYTGLKDKNGKEIYEGDVVETIHQPLAQVVWDSDYACFCTITIDEVVKGEKQYCLSDIKVVIGNIHQHPELLNNNK